MCESNNKTCYTYSNNSDNRSGTITNSNYAFTYTSGNQNCDNPCDSASNLYNSQQEACDTKSNICYTLSGTVVSSNYEVNILDGNNCVDNCTTGFTTGQQACESKGPITCYSLNDSGQETSISNYYAYSNGLCVIPSGCVVTSYSNCEFPASNDPTLTWRTTSSNDTECTSNNIGEQKVRTFYQEATVGQSDDGTCIYDSSASNTYTKTISSNLDDFCKPVLGDNFTVTYNSTTKLLTLRNMLDTKANSRYNEHVLFDLKIYDSSNNHIGYWNSWTAGFTTRDPRYNEITFNSVTSNDFELNDANGTKGYSFQELSDGMYVKMYLGSSNPVTKTIELDDEGSCTSQTTTCYSVSNNELVVSEPINKVVSGSTCVAPDGCVTNSNSFATCGFPTLSDDDSRWQSTNIWSDLRCEDGAAYHTGNRKYTASNIPFDSNNGTTCLAPTPGTSNYEKLVPNEENTESNCLPPCSSTDPNHYTPNEYLYNNNGTYSTDSAAYETCESPVTRHKQWNPETCVVPDGALTYNGNDYDSSVDDTCTPSTIDVSGATLEIVGHSRWSRNVGWFHYTTPQLQIMNTARLTLKIPIEVMSEIQINDASTDVILVETIKHRYNRESFEEYSHKTATEYTPYTDSGYWLFNYFITYTGDLNDSREDDYTTLGTPYTIKIVTGTNNYTSSSTITVIEKPFLPGLEDIGVDVELATLENINTNGEFSSNIVNSLKTKSVYNNSTSVHVKTVSSDILLVNMLLDDLDADYFIKNPIQLPLYMESQNIELILKNNDIRSDNSIILDVRPFQLQSTESIVYSFSTNTMTIPREIFDELDDNVTLRKASSFMTLYIYHENDDENNDNDLGKTFNFNDYDDSWKEIDWSDMYPNGIVGNLKMKFLLNFTIGFHSIIYLPIKTEYGDVMMYNDTGGVMYYMMYMFSEIIFANTNFYKFHSETTEHFKFGIKPEVDPKQYLIEVKVPSLIPDDHSSEILIKDDNKLTSSIYFSKKNDDIPIKFSFNLVSVNENNDDMNQFEIHASDNSYIVLETHSITGMLVPKLKTTDAPSIFSIIPWREDIVCTDVITQNCLPFSIQCPSNQVPNEDKTDCISCPGNTVPNEDKTDCISCTGNTVPNTQKTGCTPCIGNTVPNEDKTDCFSCPKVDRKEANDENTQCVPKRCGPGHKVKYANTGGTESLDCQECPKGTYQNNSNFTGENCTQCLEGTTTSAKGSTSGDCKPCNFYDTNSSCTQARGCDWKPLNKKCVDFDRSTAV